MLPLVKLQLPVRLPVVVLAPVVNALDFIVPELKSISLVPCPMSLLVPCKVHAPVILPAVAVAPVVSVVDCRVPALALMVPVPSVRLLLVLMVKLPVSVPAVVEPPVVNVSAVTWLICMGAKALSSFNRNL